MRDDQTHEAGGRELGIAEPGATVMAWFPGDPTSVAEVSAPSSAQLVHALLDLDPDEQGASELVCTYQDRATLEMDEGMWSIIYSGPYWHDLSGAAFVCSGETGESNIVNGTYTLDPLTFHPSEDSGECELDEFSFDGTTISGLRHAFCGPRDVYTYQVTVSPVE